MDKNFEAFYAGGHTKQVKLIMTEDIQQLSDLIRYVYSYYNNSSNI